MESVYCSFTAPMSVLLLVLLPPLAHLLLISWLSMQGAASGVTCVPPIWSFHNSDITDTGTPLAAPPENRLFSAHHTNSLRDWHKRSLRQYFLSCTPRVPYQHNSYHTSVNYLYSSAVYWRLNTFSFVYIMSLWVSALSSPLNCIKLFSPSILIFSSESRQ